MSSDRPLQPTKPVSDPPTDRLELLIWEPHGTTHQRELSFGSFSIGRAGGDVAIPIDDPAVSRRHAVLVVDEVIEIRDEGSSNGTFVQGEALQPGRHVAVAIDEPIVVGGTTLIVRRASASTGEHAEEWLEHLLPRSARSLIKKIAGLDSTLLIVGETGTGKTALAHSLHRRRRSPGEVVTLDPDGEVLDVTDGSVMARAEGGTLLIEELSALPLPVQDALVVALDGHAKRKDRGRPRIIATSRVKPADAVALGTLRKELRYRLAAVNIALAPVRERGDEIAELVLGLLDKLRKELGAQAKRPSPEALDFIVDQAWPGNLRELEAALRGVLLAEGPTDFGVEALAEHVGDVVPQGSSEREQIVAALASCGGNQSAAAKLLGISRGTLVNRIRRYGLARPRSR